MVRRILVISNMPDYVCFKYRPVNKYLLDSLVKSAIYFPSHPELNDPFDCNIDVERAIDLAMQSADCQNVTALRQFQKDKDVIRRFREGVEALGVGSFSQTLEETLLWSHYAENHTGIALRYDFPSEFLNNEEEIFGVSAVSYDPNALSDWLAKNSDLYQSDHEKFIIGLLRRVLTAKAPSWRYEQEGRIIRPEKGAFTVPRSVLTHVIFGLRTTDQDKELIRAIVEKYYEGVKFGEAVRTEEDFGIGSIEI